MSELTGSSIRLAVRRKPTTALMSLATRSALEAGMLPPGTGSEHVAIIHMRNPSAIAADA